LRGPRYGLAVLLIAATERELAGLEGVVTGIGPVEAAVATTRALVERRPGAVLNVGLAGSRDFVVPELVIGSEALYCDTDSPLVPERSAPDATLAQAARTALPNARFCPIGTSARLGGARGCAVEAMEGFAVLRACERAGVAAVEVRVTSNAIGEPDRGLWQFDEALALLRATLPALLEALDA
jgi:nucleoside phosphorylase